MNTPIKYILAYSIIFVLAQAQQDAPVPDSIDPIPVTPEAKQSQVTVDETPPPTADLSVDQPAPSTDQPAPSDQPASPQPEQQNAPTAAGEAKQENPPNPASQEKQQMTLEEARRSAQYHAEQERIREIRRRQQEAEERRRREMGSQENVEFQSDGSVSRTDQIRRAELEQVSMKYREYNAEKTATDSMTFFMFETVFSVEEFAFEIPVDMNFILKMTIYTEENNVYGPIKDVDAAQSLKAYVYEDNTQIVGQTEFYFESVVVFPVKKDSIYTVRFYNAGVTKLVNVLHPKILTKQHIENLYNGVKGSEHMRKGQTLSSKISLALRELRRTSALDFVNTRALNGSLSQFCYFQYAEMVIVAVITFTQVHLIKKMFRTESIL